MYTRVMRWAVLWTCGAFAACGGGQTGPEGPGEVPTVAFAEEFADGTVLSGLVTLSGSASAGSGIFKVEIQINQGELVLASGKETWTYPFDTRKVANGTYTLTAWVTDRKGQTNSASRQVQIENAGLFVASSPELSALTVTTWDRLRVAAWLTNNGSVAADVEDVAIRAHPVGAGSPELTFTPQLDTVRIASGQSFQLLAESAFSPLQPMGTWELALTWRDPVTGVEHEGPATTVEVQRELYLGSALHNGRLFDDAEPQYRTTFLEHYDGFTPEFEMKWAQVQPQQGVYDFSVVDRMLGFAEANGKRMRGHVLTWHKSLPAWITSRTWTREEAIALLEDYVTTVMGRYKGRILEWDVVNEAFNNNGTWRTGIWYDSIGPDYIELAFRMAHAVDPAARLYYNDYDAEQINTKSTTILQELTRLKEAGVPIHGVGFQSHISFNYYPTEEQLTANLERFHAAGFVTHISEMDVRTSSRPELNMTERLLLQAELYRNVANACAALAGCTGLTTWGFTDKFTWLSSQEMPLPFDTEYQRKPAFDALEQAFGR